MELRTEPAPAADRVNATAVDANSKSLADAARIELREQLDVARSKAQLKLYDQAVATLREVIAKAGPRDTVPEALLLMASIQEDQGKLDDALATYLDVAVRYPADDRASEALFKMGQAMLRSRRRNKVAETRTIYTDVAVRYPSTVWAARALGARGAIEEQENLYQRDEILATSVPSALITYREVARLYGGREREEALWKLGGMYNRTKRYDLAARTFVELAEGYPDSTFDAWFAAAEIFDKRLNDTDKARAAYARVPSTSPRFSDAQRRLEKR